MRAVLVILIATTQITGPWLCCCGPARIAAVFTPSASAEAPPTPIQPTTPHCPLCAKVAEQHSLPDTTPSPEPSKPTTPERCPCGGVELLAVLPVSSGMVQACDLDLLLLPIASELTVLLPVEPLLPVDLTGVRELPFLTTAERLYAHHVLRC